MTAVPVNTATLARWQQELRQAADFARDGEPESLAFAERVTRRVADEMDDTMAKSTPRYAPVTVSLKVVSHDKNPAIHAGKNDGYGAPFYPACVSPDAPRKNWVSTTLQRTVTCRRCLAILERETR